MEYYNLKNVKKINTNIYSYLETPEAVFLVVCDPSINELWVTQTGLCNDLYGSKLLTARS